MPLSCLFKCQCPWSCRLCRSLKPKPNPQGILPGDKTGDWGPHPHGWSKWERCNTGALLASPWHVFFSPNIPGAAGSLTLSTLSLNYVVFKTYCKWQNSLFKYMSTHITDIKTEVFRKEKKSLIFNSVRWRPRKPQEFRSKGDNSGWNGSSVNCASLLSHHVAVPTKRDIIFNSL